LTAPDSHHALPLLAGQWSWWMNWDCELKTQNPKPKTLNPYLNNTS
jgi:hypothetical protein